MKVEQIVGLDGVEQFGVRNPRSIRGTKFSLPMPKGGKRSTDPILSEDMLRVKYPTLRTQHRTPQVPDPFDAAYGPDTWFRMSTPAMRSD